MYIELFANTLKGLKAANEALRVGGEILCLQLSQLAVAVRNMTYILSTMFVLTYIQYCLLPFPVLERIAGPATAQLAWVGDFIAGAVKAGAAPDFVSSHLYPTDPWANEQALAHGRDDFFGAIKSAASNVVASANQHGLPSTTPFLLTEFSKCLQK